MRHLNSRSFNSQTKVLTFQAHFCHIWVLFFLFNYSKKKTLNFAAEPIFSCFSLMIYIFTFDSNNNNTMLSHCISNFFSMMSSHSYRKALFFHKDSNNLFFASHNNNLNWFNHWNIHTQNGVKRECYLLLDNFLFARLEK